MKNLIRCILLTLLLCVGLGARADNIVSVSTTDGNPGDEVTVSISLDNSDGVSSLQVTIPLDENLTVVDGSGIPGSRCPGHEVTVGEKDGGLQVFVYSNTMAAISGNSGVVATFKLKLGPMPGSYTLQPSNTVLTNGEGTTVASRANGIVQTVIGPVADYSIVDVYDFGGVPIGEETRMGLNVINTGNANLVISGMTFSDVNLFSTDTQFPITLAPGESTPNGLMIICKPKGRGSINQTVTIQCNSTATKNTLQLKAEPYVINTLTVEPARGVSDEEVTISLTMRNEDAVSGYQVEFEMPNSLQFVDGSFKLSTRKQDHTAAVSLDGSTLRILVYSPDDKPFTGNEGEIGSFKVKLNGRESTDLTPTKVVLSATINNVVENVLSAVHSGYVTIVCPYINGDAEMYYGDVPVTNDCAAWYEVRNTGEAPLTISQIVFDNENFSIENVYNESNWEWSDFELPLVIPTGEKRYLIVKYNSIEEVPFNAVMQIHSNDPEMRLKEVRMTGRRYAPNYMNVTVNDVAVEDPLKIVISVDNYDLITGAQFDVVYPSDVYQVYEGNYSVAAKGQNMTLVVNQIDEKTIRYIFYSLAGNGLEPGNDRLITILLKPKGGKAPEGEYHIQVQNIKLGTDDMDNKYYGGDPQDFPFTVVNQLALGDAHRDGQVNSEDVWETVCHMFGWLWYSDLYYETGADTNQDTFVNIADLIRMVNIIME